MLSCGSLFIISLVMKYELVDVYDIFSLSDKMFCTLKALYILLVVMCFGHEI